MTTFTLNEPYRTVNVAFDNIPSGAAWQPSGVPNINFAPDTANFPYVTNGAGANAPTPAVDLTQVYWAE